MTIKTKLLAIILMVLAGGSRKTSGYTLTTLYQFGDTAASGRSPEAGLVPGGDGYLYGTTAGGGTSTSCSGGCGVVFRISPDGSLTNLYSFGGPDGSDPTGSLVQGSDGNFYGTTYSGGAGRGCTVGCGTVFRITPSGSLTTLYSFTGGSDGGWPEAGLVQGSDGNFYGTTSVGGTTGAGSVFRISANGSLTTLHSFGSDDDGGGGQNALIQGSDGNFYGTVASGGTSTNCSGGCGVVFRISPGGSFTNLWSFSGDDGASPLAALVQGIDSNFYGTTWQGGASSKCYLGCGTVYRIGPSGSLASLYSFSGTDGTRPSAALVQGNDGYLYGTTGAGGNTHLKHGNGDGTLFRITSAGTLTTLYQFGGVATDGNGPEGLMQGSDGYFFGTTSGGGTNGAINDGDGTVYAFSLCDFSLNAINETFEPAGGANSVSVTADGSNCQWSAVSDVGWITITSGGSACTGLTCLDITGLTCGCGDGVVGYTVASNASLTGRSGKMTIAGQTFTVIQAGGGCTYMVSPKTTRLKARGGSGTVTVNSNFSDCDWTAASNDPFITIVDGPAGPGRGSVKYIVASNATTVPLVGTMTIAGETVTVDEAAARCVTALDQTQASFDSTGGSSNVTVTANGTNCAWKAVATGSFIQITSGASGEGDATINYTVEPNRRTVSRKGMIVVGKQKLAITQSAAP